MCDAFVVGGRLKCFIALIICSTCFGHTYAHHQEFETILVLLLHMVCDALVVGVRIECFITLIIFSTCFGHSYAHHQELETILVLLPHMVCDALVVGGRLSGAGQQAMCPVRGMLLDSSSVPHRIGFLLYA